MTKHIKYTLSILLLTLSLSFINPNKAEAYIPNTRPVNPNDILTATLWNTMEADLRALGLAVANIITDIIDINSDISTINTNITGLTILTTALSNSVADIKFVTGSLPTQAVYNAGNVGIGTNNPSAKLEVMGGAIKASGGFILETRVGDPLTPVNGQMWLVQ